MLIQPLPWDRVSLCSVNWFPERRSRRRGEVLVLRLVFSTLLVVALVASVV